MDSVGVVLQAAVVLAAILIGVRKGGVGIGVWGGVGVAVLVFVFGLPMGSPPIDALLIIVAVILATSSMQASGGIDWLVTLAARVIRRSPGRVTIVAPLVGLVFSMAAGTSNILFALLPVIQETAVRARVRPSKPMSMSVVATSIALACSPVSAAMAAMIVIMDGTPGGWSVAKLLMVTVPSAVIGVVLTALLVSRFGGADLDEMPHATPLPPLPAPTAAGRATAAVYLAGVAMVVVFGMAPQLRPVGTDGKAVSMAVIIQLIMLVIAAVIIMIGRPDMRLIPTTDIFVGGMTAAIAFFGLAWMIDTFLKAHVTAVESLLGSSVQAWPWVMALAIFAVGALTTSQSTATRMMIPLGLAAGLPMGLVVGQWVGSLGGIYLLPTNGLQIAAANFDTTGTTKLGTRLYDHSFFLPSLALTVLTVATGSLIGTLLG